MNYQKVYMNHIHSSSLLCQLAQMWRSQLLCDALICTGNVVTKAHRVVLLAACPMLQSMENASIGTELEVRLAADIKQEAVTTFLQYLYEGFMLLTEDNVKHVEKVARLLQVDSVIKCCSDFFKCLEKSTGKAHNANYKFDKYDLLEFRHVRATGLQKTYHDRLMKRMSESPRPTSPIGGKRQRLHPRPSTPPSDFLSQRTDDAASMAQSYMSGIPTDNRTGSVRSGASSQSSRSGSPSVVEIIEDSLELIQREKPGPGQPEPPAGRLAQQKTSISVASHVSNVKDTRVVSIADDSGGGRTRVTDSFSDRVPNVPSSPQQSSQTQMPVSPKVSFRETHQNIQHPSPTSFVPRVTPNQISFTSQPPPPPLQQAGTLNIAPLSQSFPQERFQPRSQELPSSQSRPSPMSTDIFMSDNAVTNKTSQSFMTSTPQRSHPSFPPVSGAKPSFAAGSAAQAGQSPSIQPSTSQSQESSQNVAEKSEKRETESSRPQEGHDPGPGPSDEKPDTPDLAIVKIEKVGEDETGGLLLQVDSGQGDAAAQMQRLDQFRIEEEQEYDESDLTGDWSQEDVSNEGSTHIEDPSGSGAMYMGPTSASYGDVDDKQKTGILSFLHGVMSELQKSTKNTLLKKSGPVSSTEKHADITTVQKSDPVSLTEKHDDITIVQKSTPPVVKQAVERKVPLITVENRIYDDVMVNVSKLRGAEMLAATSKKPSSFLLNKIVELVFTREELKAANGVSSLDQHRIEAVKEYLYASCITLGFSQIGPKTFTKLIQNKMGNIRHKLKKSVSLTQK